MKHIIQELITEFHQEILPDLFKRHVKIHNIPKNIRKALVFIGMRRVGKTYRLYQHMQEALLHHQDKKKILYMNFEDDRLEGFSVKNFQTILDAYFELYPEYIKATDLAFYFDEIQNIEGWEKFIRRLLDKEHMLIFITGSSAKLLSKEIATSLRGRSFSYEVFPLSFMEYLEYLKISITYPLTSKSKAMIQHYSKTYLKEGGFPETLGVSDNLRYQMIQSYVNTAVFRDVIDRYGLSNPHIIKVFLIHCLQNIASPLSITKAYSTLKSRGETLSRGSLYAYLSYFEDAYLICTVEIFDLSTRKRQVNPSKIYCIDSAIIYAYSIKPEMESAACLENAVYIHLRKKQYENIFYYKTKSGKEVDFIVQKNNGQLELFQVSMDLSQEKTLQREKQALIEAMREQQLNSAYIITEDTDDIIKIDTMTIHIIPYWRWVIEDQV